MKKIKLKLKPSELATLIGFLEYQVRRVSIEKRSTNRIVAALMVELYTRLNGVYDLFKMDEYKFSISVSQGLALLEWCKSVNCFIPEIDELTVNKVIGIIDQKTN